MRGHRLSSSVLGRRRGRGSVYESQLGALVGKVGMAAHHVGARYAICSRNNGRQIVRRMKKVGKTMVYAVRVYLLFDLIGHYGSAGETVVTTLSSNVESGGVRVSEPCCWLLKFNVKVWWTCST